MSVFSRLKLCSKLYLTHKLSMRIHHRPNPKKKKVSSVFMSLKRANVSCIFKNILNMHDSVYSRQGK